MTYEEFSELKKAALAPSSRLLTPQAGFPTPGAQARYLEARGEEQLWDRTAAADASAARREKAAAERQAKRKAILDSI